MAFDPAIHPSAKPYYDRATLEVELQATKERIEEWSYDEDPYGYCHVRPDLLLLVQAVEDATGSATLPRLKACPKCGSDDLHTLWQPSGDACSFRRRHQDHRPCQYVKGEHVEVHCRGCSYGWNEDPLDG